MEFMVATNNAHKLEEIRRILQEMGHRAVSLAEIGLAIDPEETGKTFDENARIKATAVCAASGKPTIADDSGLAVDALDGAPGIYSARFAVSHNDTANNEKLLALLKDVPEENRTARFVSAVALVMPDGSVLQTQGSCEGRIGFEPKGTSGFGYDPLFLVNGRSFAQMSAEEKDSMSHRARALQAFAAQLPQFLQQHANQA